MSRILHFSDVHFGAENVPAVAAALEHAHASPPDLVLVTGDVTQMGQVDEFEAAAAWLKAMPEPLFVIPGNHDTPYWDAVARLFYPWRLYEEHVGHPAVDHQFETETLSVRGINTARAAQFRANWSKGAIDLEQTQRAADALSEAPPGALRIVACHHPLIEMVGTPMTGGVRRGEAAAKIFADSGVDLIMTGHVHVPFALPIVAGVNGAYAVGAGTLSLRERGSPAGFNCIEWDDAEIHVTAFAWSGSGFVSHRVWSLDRRRR
jgi:3',5'-cyclic AMP phosphodiesterase CpdA